MIKNNKTKQVDVGQINQYVFINHSTIGFYSHILKLKEKQEKILGKNKLFKIVFTLFNFFKVIPIYNLTIHTQEKTVCYETCLVFIGNNYHETTLLEFGERDILTSGLLAVYILKCKTRWEIFKCIMSMFFNTFDKKKFLTEFTSKDLIITAQSPYINVDIDGDLNKLEAPLKYTILNKKLKVFIK